MGTTIENFSAFQGKDWQARTASFHQEIDGKIWSKVQVNSEYGTLQTVLLYCPKEEILGKEPNSIQHLEPIDLGLISENFRKIAEVYRAHQVDVHFLQAVNPPPNLFYLRDLFFMSPEGAVIARTASRIRAGEEKFAAAKIAELGIPIQRTINGNGLFEGADALWLNSRTVLCGVGNRTNEDGYLQLKDYLRHQNINCLPVTMPQGVQHLLGILQLIDVDLALVRGEKAPYLENILRGYGIRSILVKEGLEVDQQGMNVVCLGPRKIMMPSKRPELKELYLKNGLTVVEIDLNELIKGAGGLACATGVLARGVC